MVTGKISEKELEVLSGHDVAGAGITASSWVCAGVVAVTLTKNGCPSKSCTNYCVWNRK
jgi:hypothetical protein